MSKDRPEAQKVGQLLHLNGLDYRIPPSLSVVVQRSTAAYAASAPTYSPGNPILMVCSSGAQYVCGPNSYVKFKVTIDVGAEAQADQTVTFGNYDLAGVGTRGDSNALEANSLTYGNPGATALFNRMRISHSSGTTIDEVNQHLDALTYQRSSWMSTRDWKSSIGSNFDFGHESDKFVAGDGVTVLPMHNFLPGYNPTVINENRVAFASQGLEKVYAYPLSCFSDFYNQPSLIPSFLAAGHRLQVWTNSAAYSFIRNSADPPADITVIGYTISEVVLYPEQYQLTDAIAKTLASTSVGMGLEFAFDAWEFNQQITAGMNVNLDMQVTQSLSRANKCMLITREEFATADQIDHNTIVALPMHAGTTSQISNQVQLGGEYIPIQPIETIEESYYHSLIAWNAFMGSSCTNTNYYNDWRFGGRAAPTQTLESSSSLWQSGAAISPQRTLLWKAKRVAPTVNNNMRHVLFVNYTKLTTTFGDNTIVRQ